MNTIKRIAINTGGGDAPGLNAVIHAARPCRAQSRLGNLTASATDSMDCSIPKDYPDGGLIKLTRPLVRNIAHLGGTILGTSNYGNPFKTAACRSRMVLSGKLIAVTNWCARFRERRLDALISVGGDGSLNIARDLNKKGLRVIGVPKDD
jgi:6-phosphofructokinase